MKLETVPQMHFSLRCFFCGLLTLLAGTAQAQTPNGYASIVNIPIVVQSSTYSSDIYIHNPRAATLTISPWFLGATGSANPGFVACQTIAIAPNTTAQYGLAALCPALVLGGPASTFGRLRLSDVSSQNLPFAAYTRVQTFSGNGFSIEGFPIGNFTAGSNPLYVTGLKRQAAAPGYATNCFIAAIEEPNSIQVSLFDQNGGSLGSGTFPLAANEMIRLLDVFAALGAPSGDYDNASIRFTAQSTAAYEGFCTVQNNASFDADLRIAKLPLPIDARMAKFVSTVVDGLGNTLSVAVNSKDVHAIFLQHPDYVSCRILVAASGMLEMRIKDPQGNVVAGGNNVEAIPPFFLGEKSTRNAGRNGMWHIEVEPSVASGGPFDYGITCSCGNGCSTPLRVGTVAADF